MNREKLKKLQRKNIELEEQLIETRKELAGIIRKIETEEKNFFELEEITSSHTYPFERRIKSIEEQFMCLQKYFPTCQYEKISIKKLPKNAEGWMLIPKFSRIAPTYNEAFETVLEILTRERQNFLNGREGELKEEYLRLNYRTAKAIEILERTKKGDYLVIPVQLGKYHLGRSSRRTQILFKPNEFALGPLEISIFLLTHPEWLTTENDLGIDCIGGEYGPYKHARFNNILCFYFLNGKLHLNDRWKGCPDKKFGAATAFIPKKFQINLKVE